VRGPRLLLSVAWNLFRFSREYTTADHECGHGSKKDPKLHQLHFVAPQPGRLAKECRNKVSHNLEQRCQDESFTRNRN
jgi:hypothetical protein